jgi:choline dehydrogenase-like flavoprotein
MARLARAAGAPEIFALGSRPAWFDGRTAGGDAGPATERAFDAYLERLARFDFGPNRGSIFSAHQMGTLRMGADPAGHPADPRGRVRADATGPIVRGLYVADTSTFPTGLGANPMLTVMAIARRVGRTVLAESPGG